MPQGRPTMLCNVRHNFACLRKTSRLTKAINHTTCEPFGFIFRQYTWSQWSHCFKTLDSRGQFSSGQFFVCHSPELPTQLIFGGNFFSNNPQRQDAPILINIKPVWTLKRFLLMVLYKEKLIYGSVKKCVFLSLLTLEFWSKKMLM